MRLREFEDAFNGLADYGSSVWEQGFNPDSDSNPNALRYFHKWLKRNASLFEDADEHLAALETFIGDESV
jgi:hypothetical protein